MNRKLLTIASLIGIGVCGRLIPHIPNATPITAIAVAGSKHVGKIWSILIPITAMFVSDAIIGFYDWRILLSVYISFVLIGIVSFVARRYSGILSSIFIVICPALLFFLITNFAVWFFSPWFEKSIWGLLYAYELGIPFLRNMLLGDLLYVPLILGVFNLASLKIPAHLARTFRNLFWKSKAHFTPQSL